MLLKQVIEGPFDFRRVESVENILFCFCELLYNSISDDNGLNQLPSLLKSQVDFKTHSNVKSRSVEDRILSPSHISLRAS